MKKIYSILLCAALLAGAANAISPAQLNRQLLSENPPILIDLRSRAAFLAGSLPNAMNMPLREALEKPFSGSVVFFDDGLGADIAGEAAAAMAVEKSGKVQADRLAGGYAGWCDIHGQTDEPSGLKSILVSYTSYQQLTGPMTANADDIVVIDLRPEQPAKTKASKSSATQDDLLFAENVDLGSELPSFRISRNLPNIGEKDRRNSSKALSAASGAPSPLYVLIDSGDGSAAKTALKLKAAGHSRVTILAGGETIIKRRGKAGLVRRGPSNGLAGQSMPLGANNAVISDEGKSR